MILKPASSRLFLPALHQYEPLNLAGHSTVAREYNDGSRYYDHDVTTDEEIQKGADTPQPITKMGAEKSTPFIKHSLAEWWAKVNKISASNQYDPLNLAGHSTKRSRDRAKLNYFCIRKATRQAKKRFAKAMV